MGRKGGQDNQSSVSLEMDRVSSVVVYDPELTSIQLWRPVFEEFDRDHDGRVSLDYLKEQVQVGNSHLQDIPPDVLEAILERADWDQDRSLTYNEFLALVSVTVERPV